MQPTASHAHTSTAGSPLRLAQLGAAGIVAFVHAIIALHVLAPELDPRTHFMSEYGLTRYGWLFATGLVALGLRGPDALQRLPVRGALRILAGVLVLAFLADFAPPEAVRGLTQRVFVLTCVAWLLALARGLGTADGVASRS